MNESIITLALAALRESPTNPRKTFGDAGLAELAESIKSQGVLQPIVVRRVRLGDPDIRHTHEIVFGHRRFRAATLAGLERIPAIERTFSDEAACVAQLHENLERTSEPLNPTATWSVPGPNPCTCATPSGPDYCPEHAA